MNRSLKIEGGAQPVLKLTSGTRGFVGSKQPALS